MLRHPALIALICLVPIGFTTAAAGPRVAKDRAPEPAAASRFRLEQNEAEDELLRVPGDGYVVSPAQDGGEDALAALRENANWLRVGIAAEQLASHGVKEAIPELHAVAAHHWFAPVRETARHAIRMLQGEEPVRLADESPDSHLGRYGQQKWWIQKYEAAALAARVEENRAPATRASRSFFAQGFEAILAGLDAVRLAIIGSNLPKFDQVLFHRPGRPPVLRPFRAVTEKPGMKPRVAIRFAGGELLGYNEGEFGGGIIYFRKGATPLFFNTGPVVDFVRMPSGVWVVADGSRSPAELLFLATQTPGQGVTVTFFMNNPGGRPELLSSGETRIRCPFGTIKISPVGEITSMD